MSDTTISKEMWTTYYLTSRDHRGLSYEAAAEEMGITAHEVVALLLDLHGQHPDLFVDIGGDRRRFDHKVARLGSLCDRQVKQKF